jgi:hypothetical protein
VQRAHRRQRARAPAGNDGPAPPCGRKARSRRWAP